MTGHLTLFALGEFVERSDAPYSGEEQEGSVRSPEELITIHHEATFIDSPVLVHAFAGFVDAGGGVRLAADHILSSCEHTLLASFDVDELLDYRARRPRMSFVVDHFASVDMPQILLYDVTDANGSRFLLLVGPEPDYQWLRFMAAVDLIVARYHVRLAAGLSAIPWPAPHTRPLGVTIHGSDPSLVFGIPAVNGEIEVPGHVGAMLELHLGQSGLPSLGVTAQVPHYLVQFEYPKGAVVLLEGLASSTGLVIPHEGLASAARAADSEVAKQLDGNDEFATVVSALEQQYDQIASSAQPPAAGGFGSIDPSDIPDADDIAAQVEEFLAGLADTGDEGKDSASG